MLSKKEIRALIVIRLQAITDSCSSHHINHVEGQIRALCAVLNDGKAPPATGNAVDYLTAAGIPHSVYADGSCSYAEDWCYEHGIKLKENKLVHPKFENF